MVRLKKNIWIIFFLVICILYMLHVMYRRREGFEVETATIERYISRTDTSGPTEVSGVPLVVYRSWQTENIPMRMMEAVKKTMAMTPEFDNHFFTDKDCIDFIDANYEPNVGKAFRALKPGAYKSDLWRCCILYTRGGIYIDIKLELYLPLKPILEKHPKIFIVDEAWGFSCENGTPLWNGVMSSPPGNPMFKACIDEIVENCKNKEYRSNDLEITGPCLLGKMMERYEGKAFMDSLPFKHTQARHFFYNDQKMFMEYEGYRQDQAANKTTRKRYGELWKERDIYVTDITFD